MTDQLITFKVVPEPGSDDLVDYSIMADVEGGYAVHPSIVYDEFAEQMEPSTELWTVTHVKPGLACGAEYESRQQAEAWRTAIMHVEEMDVAYSAFSLCDLVTFAPRLAEQAAEAMGEDVKEMRDKVVRNAEEIAKRHRCE